MYSYFPPKTHQNRAKTEAALITTMPIAAASTTTTANVFRPPINSRTANSLSLRSNSLSIPSNSSNLSLSSSHRTFLLLPLAGGGGGGGKFNGGWSGGGGGDDGDEGNEEHSKTGALVALAVETGRSLDSLPKDLKAAIVDGRISASIVQRYFEIEKSNWITSWLLRFGGFRERLLADDLFLTKVFIECGVGLFTKTAAEYQRRGENFFNELDIVFSDVVMAIVADFMLVYLPAPTVSLRPPITLDAGSISTFFYSCPDNAFQIALGGTSFSLLQRLGAIVRNGSKLFVVGTASSLVGTLVTNALINARRAVDKSSAEEAENVPVLSTAAAYGVYMAISSNLRYQLLAGVVEQRVLEPLLHQHKSILSAVCFAVRTGNTYLGSLLWVDYARWIGLQKSEEIQANI